MRRILSGALAGCLILTLAGCDGQNVMSAELTDAAEGVPGLVKSSRAYVFNGEEIGLTDLSVELFRQICCGGGNAMVSPLSLVTDLTMVARGAKGETLKQMENGLGGDADYMTAYLQYYLNNLPQTKNTKMTSANSVWIRDDEERLTVKDQFLVDVREYFGAEVYRAAFDDETVKDMNRWCSRKTDGMVKKMIEMLPDTDMIHLLNAICFDGAWQTPYEKGQVREDVFIAENREGQNTDFMFSTEYSYLKGAHETGFVKPYKDGYSFVALLPEAGLSMKDYVQSMTGEGLRTLLFSASSEMVETAMPAFQMEYTADSETLIPVLQSMGMTDLFEMDRADLTGIGESSQGNLFVSSVVQKCFIEVDAEGTRAAAVTDIGMTEGAAPEPVEVKTVRLDRPFVFAIIDDQCGVPVFLGVVTEVA